MPSQKPAVAAFFNDPPNSLYDNLLGIVPGSPGLPTSSIVVLDASIWVTPPTTKVPDWRTLIQNFQSAGMLVLGYVPTDDGTGTSGLGGAPAFDDNGNPDLVNPPKRWTTGQINGWVDTWYNLFTPARPDGIFFDEGPDPWRFNGTSTAGALLDPSIYSFYVDLHRHVHTYDLPGPPPRSQIVMLNAAGYQENVSWVLDAGTILPGGTMLDQPAAEIALLWETEACRYFFNYPTSPPAWWTSHRPDQIAHTIFDCQNAHNMQQVVALSKQRGAGYVYVIDSPTANYNHLAPYWNVGTPTELDVVAAASTLPIPAMPSPASYNFYVRDWTVSPTSHDMGQEPSINPVFYTTSDVWNSLLSTGSTPFNSNDQPISNDVLPPTLLPPPPNDSNYAYVRVERNPLATDSAVAVAAQFLWADFGLGTNFVYANKNPSNTKSNPVFINFSEGDSQKVLTNGFAWNIPPTHSDHVCLAVEISNACDRIKVDLNGKTPGSTSGDPIVLNDNNLAQRNLGVIMMPTPSPFPLSGYAIIHNGELVPRNIEVRYEVTQEAEKTLELAAIEVIDQQRTQSGHDQHLTARGKITLDQMQPGENRWIGVTLRAPTGSEGQLLPVLFYELIGDTVLNGFALAAQPSPFSTVILDNLKQHAMKFLRLAAAFKIDDAEEEGKAALHLFRKGTLSTPDYLHFLQSHVAVMSRVVYELGWTQEAGDPFGIRATLKHLIAAVTSDNADHAATTHSQVLHKLDAFLTMLQKEQGDIADILQTVRWQRELYSTLPLLKAVKGSHHLIKESEAFIHAYEAGQIGNDNYPGLIGNLLHIFHQTAEALELEAVEEALERDIATMEQQMGSLAGLQKAHHAYLLKLQRFGNTQ